MKKKSTKHWKEWIIFLGRCMRSLTFNYSTVQIVSEKSVDRVMNIPPGYHGIFVLCSYRCSLLVRQPMCKPGIWAMNHSFSYSNNKLVTRRPVNVKVGVVLTWVAKGGFNSIATEEQELHQPGCYKPSCSSHTHHLLCYCFTHSFSSLVSSYKSQKLSALWFELEMIDLCATVKDGWISQRAGLKD